MQVPSFFLPPRWRSLSTLAGAASPPRWRGGGGKAKLFRRGRGSKYTARNSGGVDPSTQPDTVGVDPSTKSLPIPEGAWIQVHSQKQWEREP